MMSHSYTLGELVNILGGDCPHGSEISISRFAPLEKAQEGDLAFITHAKYAPLLTTSKASAVILPRVLAEATNLPRIVTEDPYLYFAKVSQLLHPELPVQVGVAKHTHSDSSLPKSVSVAHGVVIEQDVILGENVVIGPNCFIGKGVRIGDNTRLAANVSIYHDCVIGAHCIFHSGVVIGADGFGFARDKEATWVKIPQVGRVHIGNNVEIGANSAVDRGALDDTVIGDGVKIDNLVQVAHNVQIGDNSAIAGSVGIAGSAVIGKRCMLGGQVGVVGHTVMCDDVVVSGCTMVTKSIKQPGVYASGLPMQTHSDWVKNFAHLRHLNNMAKKLKQLEQKILNLEMDKK